MSVFAVTILRGPAWDPSRGRREQTGWDEHAEFMDGLVAEGFVVLGGPIGDGAEILLAVEADDEASVRARLAPDPWHVDGTLEIGAVRPWTIWLDGRPPRPAS